MWAKRGKAELLEVLSQIQDVLAEEGSGEEDGSEAVGGSSRPAGPTGSTGTTNRGADGGAQRRMSAGGGGLRLPPEVEPAEGDGPYPPGGQVTGAYGGAQRGVAVPSLAASPSQASGGVSGSGPGVPGGRALAAANNAQVPLNVLPLSQIIF